MSKEVTNTFWGLTLNEGKRYSQTLDGIVHVSMAALEPGSNGVADAPVSAMIQHKKSDFVLCSLSSGRVLQQSLDLSFNAGEEVTFYLKGKGTVHLTGYIIPGDDYDSASDEDFLPQKPEDTDDDDSDESSDEVTEVTEGSKKRKKVLALNQSKKPKVEIIDDDDDDDEDDVSEMETDDEDDGTRGKSEGKSKKQMQSPAPPPKQPKQEVKSSDSTSSANEINQPGQSETNKKKKKKKKKNKKNESAASASSPCSSSLSPQKQVSSMTRVVEDVVIEDLKVGQGPEAKKGTTVHVYYTGKLQSGKLFDSKISGKAFKFRLGKKEVIKGWEIGVEGMKVGGKRKLVIPPKMGYGSQNVGGGSIPPNSTLHFEVELKAVN